MPDGLDAFRAEMDGGGDTCADTSEAEPKAQTHLRKAKPRKKSARRNSLTPEGMDEFRVELAPADGSSSNETGGTPTAQPVAVQDTLVAVPVATASEAGWMANNKKERRKRRPGRDGTSRRRASIVGFDESAALEFAQPESEEAAPATRGRALSRVESCDYDQE